MLIETRTQFLRLATRAVENNMVKLDFKYTSIVIRLLMMAFDAGYQLAKLGEIEVDE